MLDYRYVRNVLLDEIKETGQERLNSARVLLCGTGGLGSAAAYNLAGLGVHTIGILDFDKVELTNLNRQYLHKESSIGTLKTESAKKALLDFNSNLNIIEYNMLFEEPESNEFLKEYDVIIDCFDNFRSKFALSRACVRHKKPLIHCGVEGLNGQVMPVIPGETACLDCILEEKNLSMVNKAIAAPVVNIMGSIASWAAVNEILNLENNPFRGKILTHNLKTASQKLFSVKKNPNCKICSH